ncbi:hypothetical protein [Nocardioides marmorisolisilvae]|uniref:Uncharacterized protein n=1 Tax=Nocardioides marmorisolisilvae TaxID=1542737 RepID=A0A3N0DWK8_9ACTN|nr:hypothetical protein [Nocardioides marmorisolisilvae]RNL79985.1 hypothetical protein EFL95_13775 [Nocardioides marmorisolisilvae]
MHRTTLKILLAALALMVPTAFLTAASAETPHGSRAEVILEKKPSTGQPYYASLDGWWGHEGKSQDTGIGSTYLSLDASDGHGVVSEATIARLHRELGDGGNFDALRVAFVPFSADGSNERPVVHKGENAGEAFRWFADLGFSSALNGNKNKNDSVAVVSTLAEYTQWWRAGRPVQAFTDKLGVLDVASDGHATASATPQGRSLLDRWPAGTKISLVFYVSDGVDKDMPQVPTVKVGKDGRAMTAWMTFETVASPTNPVRTSGGYQVLTGAGTGPKAAAKPRSTATGQDQGGQAGTKPDKTGATTQPGDPGAGSGSDDGGLTGSLPGGRPTFYALLVVLLAGAVSLVTLRLRRAG